MRLHVRERLYSQRIAFSLRSLATCSQRYASYQLHHEERIAKYSLSLSFRVFPTLRTKLWDAQCSVKRGLGLGSESSNHLQYHSSSREEKKNPLDNHVSDRIFRRLEQCSVTWYIRSDSFRRIHENHRRTSDTHSQVARYTRCSFSARREGKD